MAQVKAPASFQGISDTLELGRFITGFIQALIQQVNGGLDFGANVRAYGPAPITFVTANTDVRIVHTLGKVPTGYLVVNSSVAMRVFNGATAWTQNTIFLRSDTVGVATIYVI